jgi:hypothetical protein
MQLVSLKPESSLPFHKHPLLEPILNQMNPNPNDTGFVILRQTDTHNMMVNTGMQLFH